MSRLGRHSGGKATAGSIPKVPSSGSTQAAGASGAAASPPSPAAPGLKRSTSAPRTGRASREAFVLDQADATAPSGKGSPPASPVKPLKLPGESADGSLDPSEGSVFDKITKCALAPAALSA